MNLIKNKKKYFTAAGFCLVALSASFGQLKVSATLGQVGGWMPNGWGSYSVIVTNTGTDQVTLKGWSLQWAGDEDKIITLNKKLVAKEEWNVNEIEHLSEKTITHFGKKNPLKKGFVLADVNGKQKKYPFKLEIPAAYLPEDSKVVTNGKVALSLMKSRFDNFKTIDRAMVWLNQSYKAMEELVGGTPYDGKTIVFKESVENPYFAYAGQEVILNTKFVENAVKEFEEGIFPFGWIHEMGHDFDDGVGEWYNFNGPYTEFQANFKLCYIIETIEEQSFRIPQTIIITDYPIQEKGRRLKGKEFAKKSFLVFGDKYLSDPSRNWESMSSDEMHSLFQRIQIMYGWEVYRGFYRAYRDLNKKGFSPPASREDKINLIALILSKEADVDLAPLFQTWRFPVTNEKMLCLENKYKITVNH
ncbi:M60 family metallopeptidase [Flavobacteriaceae bacterium KMM 6898]|nr:M60 family metallopeptidase [Flavobacteriaceae bacterium KMM 6898]